MFVGFKRAGFDFSSPSCRTLFFKTSPSPFPRSPSSCRFPPSQRQKLDSLFSTRCAVISMPTLRPLFVFNHVQPPVFVGPFFDPTCPCFPPATTLLTPCRPSTSLYSVSERNNFVLSKYDNDISGKAVHIDVDAVCPSPLSR